MKIVEILNEIDWSKHIILLIAYITAIFTCIIFYLQPILQDHKLETISYKQTRNLDAQLTSNAENLKTVLQEKLTQNKQIYDNMRNNLDLKTLESHIAKYLTDINITLKGTSEKNKIEVMTIDITGIAKNTQDIVNLMTNLKDLDSSIRITFPIKITKQDKKRAVELTIAVYKSKYIFE